MVLRRDLPADAVGCEIKPNCLPNVTVGMIVEALAAGRTIEQLLADFPYLEEQDTREALAFAAAAA